MNSPSYLFTIQGRSIGLKGPGPYIIYPKMYLDEDIIYWGIQNELGEDMLYFQDDPRSNMIGLCWNDAVEFEKELNKIWATHYCIEKDILI